MKPHFWISIYHEPSTCSTHPSQKKRIACESRKEWGKSNDAMNSRSLASVNSASSMGSNILSAGLKKESQIFLSSWNKSHQKGKFWRRRMTLFKSWIQFQMSRKGHFKMVKIRVWNKAPNSINFFIKTESTLTSQSLSGCRAAALQIVVSRLWRDFETFYTIILPKICVTHLKSQL